MILSGEKSDISQISLTGVRAIALIGLLAIEPKSMEEIREKFLEYNIMEESQPDDVIRVDLNTIRSMGCEISRPTQKNNFKYVLNRHPFTLNLKKENIEVVRKLFNKIKHRTDIPLLIEYDKLIKKISNFIYDDEIREEFIGASPLIRYDIDMISDLDIDCKHQNTVELMYQKPTEKKPCLKKLMAKKLVFRNDKLYLLCYSFDRNDSIVLNCKGIRSIVSRNITQKKTDADLVEIKFYLKDFEYENLTEEESVIKKDDKGVLIGGKYFNKFLAMQRVLSLGSKCVVEEPSDFRDFIVSKLKEMRSLYE